MNIFRRIVNRFQETQSTQKNVSSEDKPIESILTGTPNVNWKNLTLMSSTDDDSPWILAQDDKGQNIFMDRESYEYIQVMLPGTNPIEADLDPVRRAMTRARVFASGMYRGQAMIPEVVIDTTDAAALAELTNCLMIVEDSQNIDRCMCLGGPTIELYIEQEIAATIGLQHGNAIRWKKWKFDAPLQEGKRLTTWLTDNGLDEELLEMIYHNQYNSSPGSFTRLPHTSLPLSKAEQRLRIAEKYMEGNKLDAALVECDHVLAMMPGLPIVYAMRSLIHHKQGKWTECAQDCTEAIERGIRDATVYWRRGVSYDTLGQYSLALADCTTSIGINPNNEYAYDSRGLVYLHLGQLNEALVDITKAIQLTPEWGVPYSNRAYIHLQRNDLEAAILDSNRAIELFRKSKSPDDRNFLADALFNRGQTYRMKGDWARATPDFQEAMRLNPDIGKP